MEQHAAARALYEHWCAAYKRAMGIAYAGGAESYNLELALIMITNCNGDVILAKRAVTALLTHEKLAWVNNKNLVWCSSAKGLSFIIPVLRQSATTDNSANREWASARAVAPTARISRRR